MDYKYANTHRALIRTIIIVFCHGANCRLGREISDYIFLWPYNFLGRQRLRLSYATLDFEVGDLEWLRSQLHNTKICGLTKWQSLWYQHALCSVEKNYMHERRREYQSYERQSWHTEDFPNSRYHARRCQLSYIHKFTQPAFKCIWGHIIPTSSRKVPLTTSSSCGSSFDEDCRQQAEALREGKAVELLHVFHILQNWNNIPPLYFGMISTPHRYHSPLKAVTRKTMPCSTNHYRSTSKKKRFINENRRKS